MYLRQLYAQDIAPKLAFENSGRRKGSLSALLVAGHAPKESIEIHEKTRVCAPGGTRPSARHVVYNREARDKRLKMYLVPATARLSGASAVELVDRNLH